MCVEWCAEWCGEWWYVLSGGVEWYVLTGVLSVFSNTSCVFRPKMDLIIDRGSFYYRKKVI